VKRFLKTTFLSEVILNAHTATEGKPLSLDYIPGSVFLGLAAEHYSDFGEKAFDVFHGGKVRFGDGHLAKNNTRSLKMPLAWFYAKGEKYQDADCLLPDQIYIHHQVSTPKADQQLKQIREGFFTRQGSIVKIQHSFALKSAYDSEKRRSETGLVYGYDSLCRGLEWISWIESEDEALLDAVVKKVIGERYIGRSRSSQYGRVKIEAIEGFAIDQDYQSDFSRLGQGSELVVYAEGNLCFLDAFGQPTYQPDPVKDFGLPSGSSILWDKSQIRTDCFAPWNHIRKSRDLERVCIDKGSVIVFQTPEKWDASQFQAKIAHGVGIYRSEGMGEILVNPEFLMPQGPGDVHPKITVKKAEPGHSAPVLMSVVEKDPSDQALLEWVEYEVEHASNNRKVIEKVNELVKQPIFRGIPASQWGAIRDIAQSSGDYSTMMEKLFEKSERGNRQEDKKRKKDPGFLMHGKSEKIWQEKERREKLQKKIEEVEARIGGMYAIRFVVNLCAEMAKQASSLKSKGSSK